MRLLLATALIGCVASEPKPPPDPLPEERPLASAMQIASGVNPTGPDAHPLTAGESGVYWIADTGLYRRAAGVTEQLSDLVDLTHVFVDRKVYAYARAVREHDTYLYDYAVTVVPLDGSSPTELMINDVEDLAAVAGDSVWYTTRPPGTIHRRFIASDQTTTYPTQSRPLQKTHLDESAIYLQTYGRIERIALTDSASTTEEVVIDIVPKPFPTLFGVADGRGVVGTNTEDPDVEHPPVDAQISVVPAGETHSQLLADYGEIGFWMSFAATRVGADVLLLHTRGIFRVRADNTIERFPVQGATANLVGGDNAFYYERDGTLYEQVLP